MSSPSWIVDASAFMWGSCDAAAAQLDELRTKEQALTATASELADRQAELQTQEADVKSAQASLHAQEEQLASEQQACLSDIPFAICLAVSWNFCLLTH